MDDAKVIRYAELDWLRATAIIGMVVYHATYDLSAFYGWNINVMNGGWFVFERLIASTFLLLVGISFAISYNRTSPDAVWHKFLKRGLIVLACGMVVSIVTYAWGDRLTYVRFGVLHLIGVSIMLLPFFARLRWKNAIIGIVVLALGEWCKTIVVPTSILIPLGLLPPHFETVDYFPLFPWFGVILIGHAIGQAIYVRQTEWRTHLPSFITNHHPMVTGISAYSLPIYMVHQPILLLVMLGIFGK